MNRDPKLSVIIPAYDEENRVRHGLADVLAYLEKQDYGWEVIVVDDGSRDRTAEVVEQLEQLRVLEHGGNILAVEIAPSEAHFFWEVNHPADLVRAAALLAEDAPAEGGMLRTATSVI